MKIRTLWILLFLTSVVRAGTPAPEEPLSGLDQAYAVLEKTLLEQARQQSEQHQRELRFSIRELDARLTLPTCPTPPQLTSGLNLQYKRQTLSVQCPGGWTVRIPVELEVMAPVLVSARTLFRGQTLDESDVTWRQEDLTRLPRGYIEPGQDWQQMRVRRTLRAGQVIVPTSLQPPLLVSKGERVVILAGSDRFSVKMTGEALSNGVKGQQIAVRNLASGRVIRGIVVARQRVKVNM